LAGISKIDLDSLSVQELTALMAAAEAKRAEKLAEAKADMLAKWRAEAAAAGMSLDAVLSGEDAPQDEQRKTRKDAGLPVPPKFRGPDGQLWSGRGRPPGWLLEAEDGGKSREDFRI
jgi:DNA-binding protein H-NS